MAHIKFISKINQLELKMVYRLFLIDKLRFSKNIFGKRFTFVEDFSKWQTTYSWFLWSLHSCVIDSSFYGLRRFLNTYGQFKFRRRY